MMSENITQKAIEYISELFRNNAGGHDTGHTLRVYRNALRISETEGECNREVVALAALLHDADDHKLFHTAENANARTFLKDNDVPTELIEMICVAINAVSFSQNRGRVPEDIEGRIVQDADRLDALGAIGVARTFAYGGEHGRPMEESLKHFHEKLLLLKDGMNTVRGKEMAESRHAFLETFLKEWETEQE